MSKVRISNKLPQVIDTSILDENGAVPALRLEPNADAGPFEKDCLTAHVESLVAKGYVRLRPA